MVAHVEDEYEPTELGEDEEAEMEGAGMEEGDAGSAMVFPCGPTAKMVADHNVSHLPFRAWCMACVRGRGRACGHRTVNNEDDALPTVSVDYGFFDPPNTGEHAGTMPVLVVRERMTKYIRSHPVPTKGLEHPWGYKQLLNDLNELGFKRLILKSDQEPAIKALCDRVKAEFSGDVVPENAPKEVH